MLLRPLFVITLLTPALALAQAKDPVPNLPIESYVLPNGLKVVLHRDVTVPRVTVCVAYHVGSKNEGPGRTGFAHFFEHMMFRGTKNVPNYDIPLQETGAQSNAFTSEDMTVYYETVPAPFLDRALYLEAERLAFLPTALEQAKFDTEREVVKNERRQSYENVPYGLAEETLLAKVFPKGHPYSWSVIGSMKDLDAATLKDLTRFFVEFYHPGNASLCLAGDFDPAKAKEAIARYFGPIPAGPTIGPVVAPAPALDRSTSLAETDKVTLPRLYWAWPTVADDDPDAPALSLLASVLTDGESARFHRALVRDLRVATEVDASSETKEVSGLFTIDATAAGGKTTIDLANALQGAFADLAKNPPTADELARALAKFERGTFKSLTSPTGRAFTLAMNFVEKGDPTAYRTDYARYYKVTPADLARVAKKYLTADKVALTISPAQPGEAKSPAVQAGPLPGPKDSTDRAPRVPKSGPDWSVMPGPSDAPAWSPPRHVRKSLSNGMQVWIIPWKTLPIAEAILQIPVGTADDPATKSGLATLSASLLDKGTKTKTDTAFADELEVLGARLAVGAGPDSTTIGLSVLSRNLGPSLGLIAEMLTSPRLDPVDFDRERGLQLEALTEGPDYPAWIARRSFRALLFGDGHPYARPDDGFESTVKGITLDDVRGSFDRFAANRSRLIVVGDVDPEGLVANLEATIGTWKTTGPAPSPRPPVETRPAAGVVHLADKPGAVQSVIAVGRPWVGRADPRYFATIIGNHVLGDDFLSRLNANLREKNGYSYGCNSAFSYRRTGGTWQVSSNVRADVTTEALKEILGELDGLPRDRPLTDPEIATARDAEVRSYPESFQDPSSIAGVFATMAQFGLPENYPDTVIPALVATPDVAIKKVMDELVNPARRTILIVGDATALVPKLKAAGFREIRLVNPDGKVTETR